VNTDSIHRLGGLSFRRWKGFRLTRPIEVVILLDKVVTLIMDILWAEVYSLFSIDLESKYMATAIESPYLCSERRSESGHHFGEFG
jgi:hypothetical protein